MDVVRNTKVKTEHSSTSSPCKFVARGNPRYVFVTLQSVLFQMRKVCSPEGPDALSVGGKRT